MQGVNDVAWDPDDRYLATASDDKTLVLWAAQTGERLRTLEGHSSFAFCCAFSPLGSSLVTSWIPCLLQSCAYTTSWLSWTACPLS